MRLLTIAPDGTATLHALRPLHVLRDLADAAENRGGTVKWIENTGSERLVGENIAAAHRNDRSCPLLNRGA